MLSCRAERRIYAIERLQEMQGSLRLTSEQRAHIVVEQVKAFFGEDFSMKVAQEDRSSTPFLPQQQRIFLECVFSPQLQKQKLMSGLATWSATVANAYFELQPHVHASVVWNFA